MEKTPLLSICIPTYNRSSYLDGALLRFRKALATGDYDAELIVSDNHSTDSTREVVERHISEGLECRYFRNEKNLGFDGNFMNCFRHARGKYIWLLSDDDYLIPEKFGMLYKALEDGEYGLVHLEQNTYGKAAGDASKVFHGIGDFLEEVNVFITFLSANILRKEIVDSTDPSKYMGTNIVQVPFYLRSALSRPDNLIIREPVLDPGKAYSSNGGYNLFQVFCANLNGILRELVRQRHLGRKEYARIVKKIYCSWLCEYVVDILILRRNRNFKTGKAWRILFREYWNKPYFYCRTARKTANKLLFR